jgi:hypothetical protein
MTSSDNKLVIIKVEANFSFSAARKKEEEEEEGEESGKLICRK